jgi:hypothetical protein
MSVFPFLYKDILTEHRILGWQFFPFGTYETYYFLLVPSASEMKSEDIWIDLL